MIHPTIGRKVWYWPHVNDGAMNLNDTAQPCDATVVYVWGDTCVNLRITDHHGNTHTRTSVFLVQDEVAPESLRMSGQASWMPYQLGQAARAQGGA